MEGLGWAAPVGGKGTRIARHVGTIRKKKAGGKGDFWAVLWSLCLYLNRGQEDSKLHLLGAFPPPEAAQTQDPKASPTTNEACQAIFPWPRTSVDTYEKWAGLPLLGVLGPVRGIR